MKAARKKRSKNGSLLSPEAMGGISGGGGFDFQTRYAACHLPIWLMEGSFHQFFFEGTGDIDIRFVKDGKSSRAHIQVKDHEVTATELKSGIEHFHKLDADFQGLYSKFTLACPSLSAAIRPIETGLARIRGAKPFYDDAPGALVPTKQELDERLRQKGMERFIEFIHSKVFIEVGHGDLCHDDRAIELFIARLLKHPQFSGRLRAMVVPAFAELMRAISANKGIVLERGAIEAILTSAVTSQPLQDKTITIWVHNWTKESFEPSADFTLDWSTHFDRTARRVPAQEVWNGELAQQLASLRKQILSERTERLIRFRGKCALSTGLAIGATFPAVGGWVFEIPQPPSKDNWRSDTPETSPYDLNVETTIGDGAGNDIVLGFNIKGDGRAEIVRYVESSGVPPRVFTFLSPPSQGGQAIVGPGDACAFARLAREHLGKLLKEHQVLKTRIFFYGPLALAVFFGQHLTSVGEIQLFEYQAPGYVPSFCLKT